MLDDLKRDLEKLNIEVRKLIKVEYYIVNDWKGSYFVTMYFLKLLKLQYIHCHKIFTKIK